MNLELSEVEIRMLISALKKETRRVVGSSFKMYGELLEKLEEAEEKTTFRKA
jgi:hypothetical protein